MSVTELSRAEVRAMTDPAEIRRAIRTGAHTGHTSFLAPGRVQGNVVILTADLAGDFLRYCQRNPKPCPLLAVSEPGEPRPPGLGEDLDIRTDVPAYQVWRGGELADTVHDIRALWRDDLVTFMLGCSFSFEEALIADGLRLGYVERGGRPWRYTTSIETAPAGPFRGPMVVTMRPFAPADAIRAVQITSRFPAVHGAPVHIGLPHLIGITDLVADDKNGNGLIERDHIPVFWACGVTPELAIAHARPAFAITHKPGHMLVTDRLNASLAVF